MNTLNYSHEVVAGRIIVHKDILETGGGRDDVGQIDAFDDLVGLRINSQHFGTTS